MRACTNSSTAALRAFGVLAALRALTEDATTAVETKARKVDASASRRHSRRRLPRVDRLQSAHEGRRAALELAAACASAFDAGVGGGDLEELLPTLLGEAKQEEAPDPRERRRPVERVEVEDHARRVLDDGLQACEVLRHRRASQGARVSVLVDSDDVVPNEAAFGQAIESGDESGKGHAPRVRKHVCRAAEADGLPTRAEGGRELLAQLVRRGVLHQVIVEARAACGRHGADGARRGGRPVPEASLGVALCVPARSVSVHGVVRRERLCLCSEAT
eukprot:scaffold234653_cov28-Tisochrysis_lutea.AAC.1